MTAKGMLNRAHANKAAVAANLLIERFNEARRQYAGLVDNEKKLFMILAEGAQIARQTARRTLVVVDLRKHGGFAMEIEKSSEKKPTCQLKEIDEEGRPDLCCCYFMDEAGQIQDPCPLPVQYCC